MNRSCVILSDSDSDYHPKPRKRKYQRIIVASDSDSEETVAIGTPIYSDSDSRNEGYFQPVSNKQSKKTEHSTPLLPKKYITKGKVFF